MCWRKEAGGGEGAADAAVKTKTPHDNVGRKKPLSISGPLKSVRVDAHSLLSSFVWLQRWGRYSRLLVWTGWLCTAATEVLSRHRPLVVLHKAAIFQAFRSHGGSSTPRAGLVQCWVGSALDAGFPDDGSE